MNSVFVGLLSSVQQSSVYVTVYTMCVIERVCACQCVCGCVKKDRFTQNL